MDYIKWTKSQNTTIQMEWTLFVCVWAYNAIKIEIYRGATNIRSRLVVFFSTMCEEFHNLSIHCDLISKSNIYIYIYLVKSFYHCCNYKNILFIKKCLQISRLLFIEKNLYQLKTKTKKNIKTKPRRCKKLIRNVY